MQVPPASPRPIRPRSWCSCASPNRSGCSITITVALGTSIPTSITVVATRTSIRPARNSRITSSRSSALSRPWTRPIARFGHRPCSSLEHRVGGPQVGLFRFLDHRQDDVDLRPASTCSRRSPDPLALRPRRGRRSAPSRVPAAESRRADMSRSPNRVSAKRARNRGRRQQQDIRRLALGDQRARCSTPNRCCSSITTRPSRWKATRSSSSAWVPTTRRASPVWSFPPCLLFRRGQPTDQQLGPKLERRQQPGERRVVLLGQQLGRRHQRRLVVVLDRQQHREQRHDRLAGADIAHEQPVHPFGGGHVGGDLQDRPFLVGGELPRQRFPQLRVRVWRTSNGTPARRRLASRRARASIS